MSKLKVYDMKGASAAEYDFADELLVLNKGSQAVHDSVVAIQAANRRGTASTLEKGEVAGSGKKPWRQKGTGRARAGYRQSPVWRGGSVVFGPKPRSFAIKINKKVSRLALKRAFSERVSAGAVMLIEELSLPEPKTKLFVQIVKSLGISGPALFVVDTMDEKMALAARNVPNVEIVRASDLNVYHVMRYPVIVVTRAGMDVVVGRFTGNGGGAK